MEKINKDSIHFKGTYNNIYEVNRKFPSGGVEGDYVEINGWAHYWNGDRGTWSVNEQRDTYWDEYLEGLLTREEANKKSIEALDKRVSTLNKNIETLHDGLIDLKDKVEENARNISSIKSEKGAPSGLAPLGEDGKVPDEYLNYPTGDIEKIENNEIDGVWNK